MIDMDNRFAEDDLLNVWHDETLVGILWKDPAGIIGFQYDNKWIQQGFPISQQLPFGSSPFTPENAKAHLFFANLLPEGSARLHIVQDLKIPDSDFMLLKALGGECAGALSILPRHLSPKKDFKYAKLNSKDIETIILRKGRYYTFTILDNRARLSLAGAQDKCPVFVDKQEISIPHDAAPTTHIMKFELGDYKNIPIYEYFLSELARQIIPVVEMELKSSKKHYYLLIKRYDRQNTNNVIRLHQEDFCQALGIGYEKKYQQDGGPSFVDCFKMLQNTSTNPIVDCENLLKWQVFNMLAGNSDAHAKNLSLLYLQENRIVLAPFYDLVCTRAIEHLDTKLAMSIGSQFDPDKIKLQDWLNLAEACDIRHPYLINMIQDMANKLLKHYDTQYENFEKKFGKFPALQRIQKIIIKQCRKTLKELA